MEQRPFIFITILLYINRNSDKNIVLFKSTKINLWNTNSNSRNKKKKKKKKTKKTKNNNNNNNKKNKQNKQVCVETIKPQKLPNNVSPCIQFYYIFE